MMNTERTVDTFIRSHGMMDSHGLYIVALSGGADSVALLLILHRLGYRVHAAHCNFKLRGAESDRDEDFVRQLTGRLGIPLHVAHFATRDYAELHRESIETAARRLRYDYFERLRSDIGAEAIAVAHHRDDHVETILMHMVRGCGLKGLAGIREVNGRVVRPLLCLSRHDIEDYLSELRQEYVTDSTNLDADEATRNHFRLNVLPLLTKVNPQVTKNIDTLSQHVREVETLVDWVVDDVRKRGMTAVAADSWHLSLPVLMNVPVPHLILAEILLPLGFRPSQIDDILQTVTAGRSGRQFPVTRQGKEYCLLVDRDSLAFFPAEAAFRPMSLPESGLYVLPDGRRIRLEEMDVVSERFAVSKEPSWITIDLNKTTFPLYIRTARPGDRFQPFGMKGSKLVSDYLTDAKVPLDEKKRQLIVEDAKGNILWVVGRRTSELCRINSDTRRALVIRLQAGGPEHTD